jgi:hypothetical protein
MQVSEAGDFILASGGHKRYPYVRKGNCKKKNSLKKELPSICVVSMQAKSHTFLGCVQLSYRTYLIQQPTATKTIYQVSCRFTMERIVATWFI